MNYNEPDEHRWRRSIREISSQLESPDVDNRAALEVERAEYEDNLSARDTFDSNEDNNMSTPDDVI